MVDLSIRHRTSYRYHAPVALWPHRLMLRPRESRDLTLIGHEVTITPPATMAWALDVFGNAVATATFSSPADRLDIVSLAEVRLHAAVWPVFDIAASAISYPFLYSDDDWTDLGALTIPQNSDPDGRLRSWARAFVRSDPTDTLSLLKDLAAGVSRSISYESRDDEGTQVPLETIDRGFGSCRDLATLFIEAARLLGFGARAVSGYLHNSAGPASIASASTTHAWAEVYLPGAGWITFDATNRSVGSANLVPVATVRDIRHAIPVVGTFSGRSDAFEAMSVEVVVREMPD